MSWSVDGRYVFLSVSFHQDPSPRLVGRRNSSADVDLDLDGTKRAVVLQHSRAGRCARGAGGGAVRRSRNRVARPSRGPS